jgi:truncated hemoglobin YjbI
MKKSMIRVGFAFLVGGVLLTSCSKDDAPVATKTLYDRLGGKDAISLVIDKFIANVVADNRINSFFAITLADKTGGRATALRTNLINQVGEATGGPLKYTGLDMVTSHKGMNIKNADFDALVEDLSMALDTYKVPTQEKTELLTALGGLRSQIVGK